MWGRLCTALVLLPVWPALAMAQLSLFADPQAGDRMDRAIAAYRHMADGGGWPSVPDGPTLRAGDSGPRVSALRARLAATDDLPETHRTGEVFEPVMERAVRRFQRRHGLQPDGIVGARTLAALNVPADRRFATLVLNRARQSAWEKHAGRNGIVVNIPDASLVLIKDGRRVLRSRVVVGLPDWPTPVLHSAIQAMDVHPYWHVPVRIARRELLPRAAREPGYLAERGIRVFAPADGKTALREVPYEKIDFANAGQIGYRLRQDAGPRNALGAVKFVFDNPYSVFLHDTPDRKAFTLPRRALSHGCVRVAAALDLARRLVRDDPALGEGKLEAAVADGKTRRLALSRPVPLHIVYLTAWVDRRSRVQFRQDVYDQDRPGSEIETIPAACVAREPPVPPGR